MFKSIENNQLVAMTNTILECMFNPLSILNPIFSDLYKSKIISPINIQKSGLIRNADNIFLNNYVDILYSIHPVDEESSNQIFVTRKGTFYSRYIEAINQLERKENTSLFG